MTPDDPDSTPAGEIALAPPADAEFAGAAATAAPPKSLCANCGAELLGPHCYACGQPVKGMVRHLSSIMADVFDTILNIDSRIFRTLAPLLLKPGFLTNEYLEGRRVRYVTPFRLYFFLSVVAFLVMQMSLDATIGTSEPLHVNIGADSIAAAQTEQEVQARRDSALAELEQAKLAPGVSAHARKGIDKAEEQLHAQAAKRLQTLHDAAAAKAAGKAPPEQVAPPGDDDITIDFGSPRWADAHPFAIAWLPAFANAKLNALAKHTAENLPRIKRNPKPFLLAAFGMLPQVLFLMMPLFALLLKVFYLFKRRLYMEHMIVALHSHSFIFLALLLLTLAGLLRGWAATAAPWLAALLGWFIFALGWWLPIYLLIMQKRVYRQGWFMTVLKYCTIGLCYTIMVSFGVGIAFIISLATT